MSDFPKDPLYPRHGVYAAQAIEISLLTCAVCHEKHVDPGCPYVLKARDCIRGEAFREAFREVLALLKRRLDDCFCGAAAGEGIPCAGCMELARLGGELAGRVR